MNRGLAIPKPPPSANFHTAICLDIKFAVVTEICKILYYPPTERYCTLQLCGRL